MKKGHEYLFKIETTEFPGIGVAYEEGLKVNIKNGMPEQVVKARISKKREDYLDAKIVEVVEKAPYEIEEKCPHFKYCGGCTSQNLPYEKQLEIKKEQVLKLFKEGDIKDFEFLGIEKSPEEYEYRNKMEFTFGDFEKGAELALGMHVTGKSFGIINTDCCQIVDGDFRKILDTVVRYFREKDAPYYRVMKRQGYLRNLVIRKGKNTGEILINIVTTSQLELDLTDLKELLLSLGYKGKVIGIIHTINDSFSDVVQADKVEFLYGKDIINENILGLNFKISPESFFQTNSKGAEKLYSIVKEFMGEHENNTVFDLYCGTGTIGQIVAPKAKKVVGIELIEEAVKAANENAKNNNLNNCHFIAGDIAEVIKDVHETPDIIILDPPRPGVHPKAMDYVIKFNAPQIIYVSCNPKTLVTDLKALEAAGYKLEKVKLMDMFPHTPHIESVVLLSKVQK